MRSDDYCFFLFQKSFKVFEIVGMLKLSLNCDQEKFSFFNLMGESSFDLKFKMCQDVRRPHSLPNCWTNISEIWQKAQLNHVGKIAIVLYL